MDKKLERRLKKLLALAERGIDGEKETAQRMLDNLLQKHNLSYSDLTVEHIDTHWFKHHKGVVYKKLMFQVMYAVCGKRDKWKTKHKRYHVGVDCTEFERMQIEVKYSIYQKELKKELELSYDAFIQVNNVFPGDSEDTSEDSPLDLDYLSKLASRAGSMEATSVYEALPNNKPKKESTNEQQ